MSLSVKSMQKFVGLLYYIEHLLILASAITECVSVFAIASLVGIPIRTVSSEVGL